MTAQINDTFFYRGERYNIAAIQGARLLTPKDFGMLPVMISTACWRGFYCSYTLEDGEFLLTQMTLREKSDNYLPIGDVSPTIKSHEATYLGLRVKVPFTGRMLLAKDFIKEMYVHMGFQRPTSYRTVYEVVLEDGKIVSEINRSAEIAALRERIAQKPDQSEAEKDVEGWIAHTFSRKFDRELDS